MNRSSTTVTLYVLTGRNWRPVKRADLTRPASVNRLAARLSTLENAGRQCRIVSDRDDVTTYETQETAP